MENVVKTRLKSVQFAEAQVYKNIAIVPLITPADGTFSYRTLGDALAAGDIFITEVSAAGSVPELLVANRGNDAVLLVDGEELAGANQNRVLKTSTLLKDVSETKIPGSCIEHGHRSYAAKSFSEAGKVMAYKNLSRKTRSVQCSLAASAGGESDQGEVWDGIAELQAKACTQLPTPAMSDANKAREDDLRKCDKIFKADPNQVRLLAFIGGTPTGADVVFLTSACTKLHPKLVRSYALQGFLDSKKRTLPPTPSASTPGNFWTKQPPPKSANSHPSATAPTTASKGRPWQAPPRSTNTKSSTLPFSAWTTSRTGWPRALTAIAAPINPKRV